MHMKLYDPIESNYKRAHNEIYPDTYISCLWLWTLGFFSGGFVNLAKSLTWSISLIQNEKLTFRATARQLLNRNVNFYKGNCFWQMAGARNVRFSFCESPFKFLHILTHPPRSILLVSSPKHLDFPKVTTKNCYWLLAIFWGQTWWRVELLRSRSIKPAWHTVWYSQMAWNLPDLTKGVALLAAPVKKQEDWVKADKRFGRDLQK